MNNNIMDKKSLIENMVSLFALKGFEYILPLITIPYLVRTLGHGNYGLIMFVMAFVQFFIIVTNYGFEFTATKKISIYRKNMVEVSKIFFSVIIIKSILGLISFIVYLILIYCLPKFNNDINLYLIGFIGVIGNIILPLWFFQGMENMKFVTFVNISIRIITTLSIFIFVKTSNDYAFALFIQSCIPLLCGILSLFIIFKRFSISFIIPNTNELKKDFLDGWHIFITSFMANILASSGTFVLGLFQSKETVGVYAAIEKLVKALIGLFSPITQSLFPRVSSKFAISFRDGSSFVYRWGRVITVIASIIVIFIMIFSKDVLIVVFGNSFGVYVHLLQGFSIWIFFSVLNNFLGIQFLIGSGNQKIYTKAFLICTVLILFLYCILTPKYSLIGIIIGVNIGEFFLTICMIYYIVKIKRKTGLV